MDLQEFHNTFSGKTFEWVLGQYDKKDALPIVIDFIYYCLPLPAEIRHNGVLCYASAKAVGFHPDVTPEMAANFISIHSQEHLIQPLMARFAKYNKIYEAVGILLAKRQYYVAEHSKNICVALDTKYFEYPIMEFARLTHDQFIFIMDIFAGNKCYALSMENNISIDHFGMDDDSIINWHVDQFKQLCIENIKTC